MNLVSGVAMCLTTISLPYDAKTLVLAGTVLVQSHRAAKTVLITAPFRLGRKIQSSVWHAGKKMASFCESNIAILHLFDRSSTY